MNNHEQFSDWYQSQWKPCYSVVRAVTLHHADAEEVLAEAFARAYVRFETLLNHPAPQAWVITTALNVYRDRNRKLLNVKRFVLSSPESYEDVNEGLSGELISALKKLSVRQREVVAFRILLDLSNEQTAQLLNLSIPTVGTHLRRGLDSLRDSLDEGTLNESAR
jgi:RNA polymerase sigma-70 factor (ECF subfamily)